MVDPYTVKIVLIAARSAPSSNNMAHPGPSSISPKALAQYGKDIATHPVGTGPFKFVSFAARPREGDEERDLLETGRARRSTASPSSRCRRTASRSPCCRPGEAQFIYPLPPELVAPAKNIPTLDVVDTPSIVARYVALNTMSKPFDDLRVRQALNYAVDKTAFAKIVFSGYAEPLDAPIAAEARLLREARAPWPYDPAKAKALLAEAGYPNGFSVELWGATLDRSPNGPCSSCSSNSPRSA